MKRASHHRHPQYYSSILCVYFIMCQPEPVDVNIWHTHTHTHFGWKKILVIQTYAKKAFISFDCKNMLCDVRWCGYCTLHAYTQKHHHRTTTAAMCTEKVWWMKHYTHIQNTQANTTKKNYRYASIILPVLISRSAGTPAANSLWWQFILLLWLLHMKASLGVNIMSIQMWYLFNVI